MIAILALFFLVFLIPAVAVAGDTPLPALPKPITSFGAAVVDDQIYVYGGHSGKAHSYSSETTLGQFLRLPLDKPVEWTALAGGPSLQGLALVAHQGQLYRIGGMQPRQSGDAKPDLVSSDSVARFDPKTGKWEELAKLPQGRSSHDAAVIGDKIYVAGGWTMNGADKESQWQTKAAVLDLGKQPLVWQEFEQPFKCRALAVAALKSELYVLGGLSPEGHAEKRSHIYNPAKGAWRDGPDLPDGVMNGFSPAACVLEDGLYLSPADGKMYRLASTQKAWEEVGALKLPRMVHRIVPSKNKLIAIGGSAKGAPTGDVEVVDVAR